VIHVDSRLNRISETSETNVSDCGALKTVSGASYESANVVNYHVDTKETTYEYFDSYDYEQRNNASNFNLHAFKDDYSYEVSSDGFCPFDVDSFGASLNSIIGKDDRTLVDNPKRWPYFPVCKISMVFEDAYVSSDGTEEDITASGTGFLMGPNLLVTAAHCVYQDVTSTRSYQDNISNPLFAGSVTVMAAVEGTSESRPDYPYLATAKTIAISKHFFEHTDPDNDWAAITLDRDLGLSIGYYGKIRNWYEGGAKVFSYGYPFDAYDNMVQTHGKLTGKTDAQYKYDMDTKVGQSGSPVFMTGRDGATYVCGVHTREGNYGTRFNDFIYNYLDSFVTSKTNPIRLQNIGKTNGQWKIRVHNRGSLPIQLEYGKKMCFLNDAKLWKINKSDIATITVREYSFVQIFISENVWATSITTSFVRGRTRFVTYANNLSSGGGLKEYNYWFDF